MKRWFEKFGQKLRVWMAGRYGYDELSRFLSVIALILVIAAFFVPWLNLAALVVLLLSLLRSYSRNTLKRERERMVYLRLTGKIRQFFRRQKNRWKQRKTHKYYKCPGCKTHLRLPKGKGTIRITCPQCGHQMTKKT